MLPALKLNKYPKKEIEERALEKLAMTTVLQKEQTVSLKCKMGG
jgi:hypothetical protein